MDFNWLNSAHNAIPSTLIGETMPTMQFSRFTTIYKKINLKQSANGT